MLNTVRSAHSDAPQRCCSAPVSTALAIKSMEQLIKIALFLLVVTGGYVLAMFALRKANFNEEKTAKRKHKNSDNEVRLNGIKFQNEAIYKLFEFYVKITIALFAGIAALSLKELGEEEVRIVLLKGVSYLHVVVAVLISIAIVVHQKSKIERWTEWFSLYECLMWVEYWFVISMAIISSGAHFWLIPKLLCIQING